MIQPHSRSSSDGSNRSNYKRARLDLPRQVAPTSVSQANVLTNALSPSPEKRRTRTGCQTCRHRHLKCDEARPMCTQCVKGKRHCTFERALKWDKYLDVQPIPFEVPVTNPYTFKDESVSIASEYVGGEEWYSEYETHRVETEQETQERLAVSVHGLARPIRAPIIAPPPDILTPVSTGTSVHFLHGRYRQTTAQMLSPDSVPYTPWISSGGGWPSYRQDLQLPLPRSYKPIDDPLEAHFMQVFIEDMGKWMDTMNPANYFSNRQTYESRAEPMLYKASLACGAAHQYMKNPDQWSPNHHQTYFKEAYQPFMAAVEGTLPSNVVPKKEILAQTSVILTIYTTLMHGKEERLQILQLSRRLIKECSWSSTSSGSEGAYYWLRRGLELLACLTLGTRPTDDAEDDKRLGLDFGDARDTTRNMETLWTRKIICVVTRILSQLAYPPNMHQSTESQLRLWTELSDSMEGWHRSIPITMLPLWKFHAGEYEYQSNGNTTVSNFPRTYLPDHASVFAQICYHTGWLLLSEAHPYGKSTHAEEMEMKRLEHAKNICGITKHVRDSTLASIMIRPCIMAAEYLRTTAERREVLIMLEDFKKETGCRLNSAIKKLQEKWQSTGGDAMTMAYQDVGTNSPESLATSTGRNISQQRIPQMHYQSHLHNTRQHSYTPASVTQPLATSYYGGSLGNALSQTAQHHSSVQRLHPPPQYMTPTESQTIMSTINSQQRPQMVGYENTHFPGSSVVTHSASGFSNFGTPPTSSSQPESFMTSPATTGSYSAYYQAF